jgi:cysteine desulfurase
MQTSSGASERIYLDHAATTPLDPRVLAAMQPYLGAEFGNPSALYKEGRTAKQALIDARSTIASILGVTPDELIFTGSGTESDNMAIFGIAQASRKTKRGDHIIVSAIEHKAVLRAVDRLESWGFTVTRLPVDAAGLVDPKTLEVAITDKTILISIMYANNEVGTVEPIAELAAIARKHKVPFHTDACQAAGALPLTVAELGVDLLTLNGSKSYGPKGVGLLYVSKKLAERGVAVDSLIVGGSQEDNRRAGTENVAAIVGFAKALELANAERLKESARLTTLRDTTIKKILAAIPDTELSGHPTERLPNNIHITIPGIEGDSIISMLDELGVAAATGSTCDSHSIEPSHVVLALGLPYTRAHGSVRFTLGRSTTQAQLDQVVERLKKVVLLLKNK